MIGGTTIITFSGTNTYSGNTTLGIATGGSVLRILGGSAIPDSSVVTMGNAARFLVNNSETIGNFENIAPSTFATVEIAEGAVLTTGANGGSTNFLGQVIGAGGLRKIGAGTFTLTQQAGINPYIGDTIVDEGTLILAPNSGAGGHVAISPSSKVSIAAGATLQFNSPAGITVARLTGSGLLKMGTTSLSIGGTGTFAGEISGSAGVSILSPNSVTFSGANSFTGALNVTGTLSVPSVADAGINSPIGAEGFVSVNGGKFVLTGLGSHSTNRTFSFGGANPAIEVVDGATLALTGSLIGDGTLRKSGLGTLRLVGDQNVGGFVRVDEGVLAISNSSLARIAGLSGGGTVDLAAGTLAFWAFGSATHSGIIQGPGSLVVEGTATSRLEGANAFTGGLTINGTLTVPDFNLPGTPGPLGQGVVTVNGSLYNSAQADVTSNRDFVVGQAPGKFGMTGNHTLTLGGLISGTGAVTAVGEGTLILTNPANSFTGPVGAFSSTLRVEDIPMSGVNSPIGAGNQIAITSGTLMFTGIGDFATDRTLEVKGVATVSVVSADTSLRLGRVTGPFGGLAKSGAGRLILTDPTNDFDGNVAVRDGILVTGQLVAKGLPSGLGRGSPLIARVSLGSDNTTGELMLLDGAGGATNRDLEVFAGGGRVRISNSTVTLNGKFFGTGSLALAGNGASTSTFVLSSVNHSAAPNLARTGPVVIESATVRTTGTGSIGAANRAVLAENQGGILQIDAVETIGSLQGGGGPNFGRVILNAPLTTGNDHTNSGFDGMIEGAATLTKIGQGILTLTGANTFTGALVVSQGAVAFTGAPGNGTSPLGSSNNVQLAASTALLYVGAGTTSVGQSLSVMGESSLVVPDAGSTLVWGGSVTGNASAQLNKEGAGTLRLSGANGFTGSTNINAGKLQVIGSNALPNEGTVTVVSGAALELLPGTNETIGALQGTGNVTLGGQKLTLGGTNASAAFAGIISGGGASQLEKTGSGTLTLSNLNSSFTGGVIISDGAISVPSLANVGVNSPLGSNGPIILGDSSHTGRLIVTNANPGATNRPIVLMSGGAAVEVAHSAAEFELGGSISGPGSLLKLGAGKLKLSSPLGGPLVVAAGTLTLNTNISGTGGAATIIAPGILDTPAGVPRGVGQLNLLSGTIAPGGTEAIGMLTAEGITFDSGTFDLDLQGTSPSQYDSLHVNGVATFNGPVELSIGLGFDPADWTDSFRIVVNDGNEAVTLNGANGRFSYRGNLLEDGEHFLVNDGGISQFFYVEYGVAGDNDIELFAAPEPGAASLLLTAGMCLFARRRRMAGGVRGVRG